MAAHKKSLLKKVCPKCGNEFTCRKSKRIFCSHKCSNSSRDYSYRSKDSVKEFWSRVIKGKSIGDCWEWSGAHYPNGYARSSCGVESYAHRLSYLINCGDLLEGLCVLHKCDNPGCVNPKHLFLGTNQDNIDDMVSKGRQSKRSGFSTSKETKKRISLKVRGEGNGRAVLSEKDATEIRRRAIRFSERKTNFRELAEEFGVCSNLISQIVRRIRWSHVE